MSHERYDNPLISLHSDVDGLRTDADGTIFVARPGSGAISVVKPDGIALAEIKTEGKAPNNLTFGGPDGRTVFVTQIVQKPSPQPNTGYVETFRAERPGREFCKPFNDKQC